ncbi:MAG TPA: ABC transporter substrate-binding protein [Thermoleophilia bacterium]|nr:ABC transporter substrate-binding protein [Thermoleophilia bacterium]
MAARSRPVSRLLILLVVLVLAAGVVWALNAAFAGASSPSAAGTVTLKVGWTTEPDNLNPFVGYEQSSYELYHLTYDFLTDYNDAYLETAPGLATSWSKSADGLTWTFKIRDGVKWSDGVPLTAHDVAFSYMWQKKLDLGAFASSLDGIKTVTAPDDTTVVIRCERPKADILSMWVPVVPQHVWSKFTTYDQAQKYLNSPPVVGSGPFQIVEWQKGKFIRLVANKSYWGGKPKVDQLVFQLYTNQDTMAQDLRVGTIDLAIDIPPAQVKALQSEPALDSQACAQKAFDYLSFNCYKGASLGNPVLRDVKFRQALNWAVDKQKLTALAYQGYADPATSVFEANFYDPKLDWHWDPPADVAYHFDLAKARQLLAAAGYKDTDGDGILNDPHNGGKDIKLRLWARTESPQSQVIGKLVTGWWESLGLNIQYSVQDDGVLSDGQYNTVGKTYKPDYDMYIWAWQPSGSDPGRRLGYFRTDQIQNQNDACWSDPQYDALWQKQSQELDPQKRKAIVDQMQEILYTQSPYIVLDYPKLLEAWNTQKWEGWKRIPQPNGAVAYISDNVSNYYEVAPRAAETTPASSGSNTTLIIGVIIAVVVIVAVVLLLLRRRPKAEEG